MEGGGHRADGGASGGGGGDLEADKDTKPGQLELIASMLAGLRQEITLQGQKQAQQAARTDQLAREQAERSEAQASRLEEALQASLASVRQEAQQYTDQACEEVRSELQRGLEALRGEVREVRLEARQAAVCAAPEEVQSEPLCGWGQCQASLRPRSAFSEPPGLACLAGGRGRCSAAGVGCGGARAAAPPLPPDSPPPSPPHLDPTLPPFLPRVPALYPARSSPSHDHRRRKPAEYDGKVAWEAYVAQFVMLATAQGWTEEERALQLATSLRGPALEILSHLPATKQASFTSLSEALQRRFGHSHQAEVYRAQLKKRARQKGETLSQLAQDVEALVRRAYPAAGEDMTTVLARDAFVDALQDHQLQIYVKQAHPGDLQVALARAMEFEAFLKTSSRLADYAKPRNDVRGRKAKVERKAASRETSPEFGGRCWGCGEKGHRRDRCPRGRRTRSLDRPKSGGFQTCCKDCGKSDHRSSACPKPKQVAQAENSSGLDKGATTQPAKVDTPRLV